MKRGSIGVNYYYLIKMPKGIWNGISVIAWRKKLYKNDESISIQIDPKSVIFSRLIILFGISKETVSDHDCKTGLHINHSYKYLQI